MSKMHKSNDTGDLGHIIICIYYIYVCDPHLTITEEHDILTGN